jgi:Uma2 family endonuclease
VDKDLESFFTGRTYEESALELLDLFGDRVTRNQLDRFFDEVLSPSTASRDHVKKKALCARQGVREYWPVHPANHILARYRLESGAFSPALIDENQQAITVEALPGLQIQWAFMTQ